MENLTISRKKSLTHQSNPSLRLSRIEGELSGMLLKLHSYLCEPCTPDMYLTYVSLDDNAQKLQQAITTIKESLLVNESNINNPEKEIGFVISEYEVLQNELIAYFREAERHH